MMRFSATCIAAAVACLLLAAGCVSGAEPSEDCPDGYSRHIEFQLFFGLADSSGNQISDAEWEQFQTEVITPRFPAGMSVIDVKGQWREPDGDIQRENTRMVRGLMAAPDGDGLRLVNEISDEFVRRFNQDPVFRIMSEVCSGVR